MLFDLFYFMDLIYEFFCGLENRIWGGPGTTGAVEMHEVGIFAGGPLNHQILIVVQQDLIHSSQKDRHQLILEQFLQYTPSYMFQPQNT